MIEKTPIYDLKIIGLLITLTLITTTGQIVDSLAFQLEKATRISMLSYSQLVIGFFWDTFYFKIKLKFNDYVGSLLIVSVMFAIAIRKAYLAN